MYVLKYLRKQCVPFIRFHNFNHTSNFLIVPQITEDLPQMQISPLKIPPGIKLADPEFGTPGSIDMLIGANIFWDLLQMGQIKLNDKGPILQKTCLG